MAITVKCAACGNVAQAPDSAAGAKAKCRSCGGVIQIPRAASAPAMSRQPARKICTACGVDVAGKKRTKDPKGNYYCQACWDAKVAAGVAVPAGAAAAGGGAAAAAQQTGGGSGDAVDYPCSVCGVLGGADDVYDDDGRYVCKACWEAQDAAAPAAGGPDPVWTADQPAGKSGLPPLPPLPPLPGGMPPAAAVPPPVPELLFCEGCGGSFTINNLTTTPDGAVLCQSCVAHRNNPAARLAYAAPAAFVPPSKPRKKEKVSGGGGGRTGGFFAAGGGGLLVTLLIVGRIVLRGCSTYNRYERSRQRPAFGTDGSVPSHVQDEGDDEEEE